MREASFVERNKEKWMLIENNLKLKVNIHPDELAQNYVELTNDLAYAQTFYPKSNTKEYLNELAIFAHQTIYKDQKSNNEQIKDFFTIDIPQAIYENRKYILYSLLIFMLATIIGWFSSAYDENFVRLILSDGYVDQTIESIQKGDPAAIYNSGSEVGTTLGITVNNIRVAFLAFAMGIFCSIGTGYVLFSNGIMLGAFHYLFHKYGVLATAMSAIWIHGAIEISVIIIAGGAGLIIGNSILFPKTYSRFESFKRAIKKAAMILVSTIPFFIIAGTLEGFVTRHYKFSLVVSISIIVITLFSIIYFYIINPYLKAKKHSWN